MSKFAMKVDDLHRILTNVLPHAGTDATLPVLKAVQLKWSDGKLRATATDRFTLGTDTADITSPGAGPAEGSGEALLPLSDAKALAGAARSAKGNYVVIPVYVNMDGDKISFNMPDWPTFTFASYPGQFPIRLDVAARTARAA